MEEDDWAADVKTVCEKEADRRQAIIDPVCKDKVFSVFEKMGVARIKTQESTFKTFMKDFKDLMGNTEVDSSMEERLKRIFDDPDELEEEVVYEYKLVSELFLQLDKCFVDRRY